MSGPRRRPADVVQTVEEARRDTVALALTLVVTVLMFAAAAAADLQGWF